MYGGRRVPRVAQMLLTVWDEGPRFVSCWRLEVTRKAKESKQIDVDGRRSRPALATA